MDPALLNYVLEICRTRRIPFISAGTLEAWKAAAESIGRISGSDEARRAAMLLSTMLDHDVRALRTAFGAEVTTITGQLTPPALRDLNSRAAYWARAASQSGATAQAAIALLAAECSAVSEEHDRTLLQGYLDILGAENGAPTSIRDEARLLSARMAPPASPPASKTRHQTALISMSIDMAGSTEAKTRMRKLAANDDRRHELYRDLYREFLRHEDRFYSALFNLNAGHGCVLDWTKFFVVKGIGDEIWILYEIDPLSDEHILSAAARLIYASLGLVGEGIEWHGTERSPDPTTTPEEEASQRFDHMDLGYKVHMDLVLDALEISEIRAAYVSGNVTRYLGREHAPFDADAAKLANRLNAGQFDVMGRRVRSVFRTDYIGHEIDRFFRTTKAALPGIVTVGQSLFERLKATSTLVAPPALYRASLQYEVDPARPGSRRGWGDLLYVLHEIPAKDLKGIGYAYRVYNFVTQPQLNALWHRAESGDDLVKPVLLVFPAALKERLKAGPGPQPPIIRRSIANCIRRLMDRLFGSLWPSSRK